MKKLEKEKLPKVIALGGLGTLLVGYAAYSWCRGSATPAPAAAATPHPAAAVQRASADAAATSLALQLAPIDNPDPFRPAMEPTGAVPPPKPAAKPAAGKPKPAGQGPASPTPPVPGLGARAMALAQKPGAALPDEFNGPAMDGLPGVVAVPAGLGAGAGTRAGAHEVGGGPGRPVPAGPVTSRPVGPSPRPVVSSARPSPPAVVVTGILEGDESVAILKWSDTQRQVVRVGDHLDGGFTVKAIRPDAVVLAHGSYEWVARLGGEKPTAK